MYNIMHSCTYMVFEGAWPDHFFWPPTYLKASFEILVPIDGPAHIFLIHILKFGVPKLGIYEEIIKNVLNK